jgi:N-acetylmuramoyl-L-alanine amidase
MPMNNPVPHHPNRDHRPSSPGMEGDRVGEISRRGAIATGLRHVAGVAGLVALPGLPLASAFLGGCQAKGEGWEPLDPSDRTLNGPIENAPVYSPESAGADPMLARPPAGVISRRQWTSATTIASEANAMVSVQRITVHHDGMPPVTLRSRSAVIDRLELIRRSHVNARGWADIGYHFVVDPMGNVWEARPLIFQGAHVKDHNERNMGVMVLGNFEEQTPTVAALAALDGFVRGQMSRFRVPVSRVVTHQELAPTACPGRSLQRHMVAVRRGSGALA